MSAWPSPPPSPEFVARREACVRHLESACPRFASLIEHVGPCRLAPDPDTFAVLVRAVLSQLISTAAAQSIITRLYTACGERLTPEVVLTLAPETLRGCGVSGAKARSVREVAGAFAADGALAARLGAMTPEEVARELRPIYGVGAWTVDMACVFSLGHLDVMPAGDGAVRAGVRDFFELAELPTPKACLETTKAWSPARSVAAWYLWQRRGWTPRPRSRP